jgi:tRNA threonylcarbamoyl adenosine modification protein YeaZ
VLLLALDTSTPQVSVALAELAAVPAADGPVAELAVVAANRHGELLTPLIDEVLEEAGRDRRDLTALAVGLGPGPFTGLRVGVVTAAALADALAVPAYGACSLDVIAAAHPHVSGDRGDFLVLTDARRRQVYWARYGGTGARLDGPDIAEPATLVERFGGQVRTVLGAGALSYRDQLVAFDVVEHDPYPRARVLAGEVAARVRAGEPSDVLEPLYLRRPDARPPAAPKKVTPA